MTIIHGALVDGAGNLVTIRSIGGRLIESRASRAPSPGKRRRANRRFMQQADRDYLLDVASDVLRVGRYGLAADLAAGRVSRGSLWRAYGASRPYDALGTDPESLPF